MDIMNEKSILSPQGDRNFSTLPPSYENSAGILNSRQSLRIQMGQDQKTSRSSPVSTENLLGIDEKPTLNLDTSNRISFLDRGHGKEEVALNRGSHKPARSVLICCLGRWFITFALSIGYILATLTWMRMTAISTFKKRVYNSIVTGVSIALGLNISSAFREIAQTMRWPILSLGKQNLRELDLILETESLVTVAKLAFVSRRPMIIFGSLAWLSINIFSQVGLAMLSLTYSFDIDQKTVRWEPGLAAIPYLDHFYPQINRAVTNQSLQDEQYTAHTYGEFALNYGIGLVASEPSPGQIYLSTDPLLWVDKYNNLINFIFLDSPQGSRLIEPFSAFTERKISINYNCSTFDVLSGGDGKSSRIIVDTIGEVLLSHPVPESTTFITNANHTCNGNKRCSVVEAFESSIIDPWYYVCEISLGQTQNDPFGISYVSDYIAQIATASIAQIGYSDNVGLASQIYPRESLWGQTAKGNPDDIGMTIGIYALASIAGAAQFNPFTTHFGLAPASGFLLKLNHQMSFYLIFFLINICHLTFVIMASLYSKSVKIGPTGNISMSLFLRPITDRLTTLYYKENKNLYRQAKIQTYVRYEKDLAAKKDWHFNISPR